MITFDEFKRLENHTLILGNVIASIQNVVLQTSREKKSKNIDEFISTRGSISGIVDAIVDRSIFEYFSVYHTNIKVLSEESFQEKIANDNYRLYLDPLNGSLHYLQAGDNYEINLILFKDNDPILGVSYKPSKKLLYSFYYDDFYLNSLPIINQNDIEKYSNTILFNKKVKKEIIEKLKEYGYETMISINDNDAALRIMNNDAICYIGNDINIWDYAVTGIILKHFGGIINDFSKNNIQFYGRRTQELVMSKNSKINNDIISIINLVS